ncbi:hypothetical protein F5884DRAFT_113468 [Xylogone sp. PMI_703]|nr:hypothetical protein F5884DRAFT_113468 [Xylogone sp. PMI_703]
MNRDPIDLLQLGWAVTTASEIIYLRNIGFNPATTTTAIRAETATGLVDFTDALAVFVRQMRESLDSNRKPQKLYFKRIECLERDPSWVYRFPVQFHSSLKCWKRTGKDYKDTERLESEYLRCTRTWRGQSSRMDYCWVQEHAPGGDSPLDAAR